jgi:hypothetical protein
MRKLELPPTLRKPNPSDLPQNEETISKTMIKLKEMEVANIVEGYTITLNKSSIYNYKFYSEINIDNSRLWDLLKTFIISFPGDVSFIFNHLDDEPIHGDYDDKYTILNKIEPYKIELTQDCFLEFGIINETETNLEEIFIESTKYLKYWGSDTQKFQKIMNEYNLTEFHDLNFFDEFPNVKETLANFKSDFIGTHSLVEYFKTIFLNDN